VYKSFTTVKPQSQVNHLAADLVMRFLFGIALFFAALPFSLAQNNSSRTTETAITDYVNDITVLGTACSARVYSILAALPANITLLDENGIPTDNKTGNNIAWGISYPDCKRICGTGFEAFDFSTFQHRFTSWLLVGFSTPCH
jgi:hypothetical protein